GGQTIVKANPDRHGPGGPSLSIKGIPPPHTPNGVRVDGAKTNFGLKKIEHALLSSQETTRTPAYKLRIS
ncbi:hypothetical protein, partial [Murinocardiopsis flavida]|uniref:hypothetical protein n=1 Tax=Murinocardiopsis flavida TaxID=645275 RepID=UPI001B802761